jgi:NAD(P)H-hydrate epimerase
MFVRCNVPAIAADSNKGSRRSVAIVAGAEFMGGAAILAAIGALRSGAGLVKVITAPQNIVAVHARIPEALTAPLSDAQRAVDDWADVLLIGPGLGRSIEARSTIKGLLTRWRGPVVVDADALNAFDGRLDALGDLLRGRPAVVTPHPGEMSRLMGCDVAEVLANRFDIGLELARRIDAAVLLKGTPTVVSAPDGRRFVSATGTAALATGGSGDALGGIVATLLAQGCDPAVAAACAAWIHGRAAELTPGVRGNRLSEVLDRLQDAWTTDMAAPAYPVLACLPAVA